MLRGSYILSPIDTRCLVMIGGHVQWKNKHQNGGAAEVVGEAPDESRCRRSSSCSLQIRQFDECRALINCGGNSKAVSAFSLDALCGNGRMDGFSFNFLSMKRKME